MPYHCLRCRANDKFLIKLCVRVDDDVLAIVTGLQAIVCNNGTLLGETLDVLSLTGEETLRGEKWEVSILHAELLELLVKFSLYLLPDSITVWFNNHTAAHRGSLCQVGLHYQVIVPLRVVVGSLCELFQFFCHLICLHYLIILQKYKIMLVKVS